MSEICKRCDGEKDHPCHDMKEMFSNLWNYHKFEPMEEKMVDTHNQTHSHFCCKCQDELVESQLARLKSENLRYRTALEKIKSVAHLTSSCEHPFGKCPWTIAEEALKVK